RTGTGRVGTSIRTSWAALAAVRSYHASHIPSTRRDDRQRDPRRVPAVVVHALVRGAELVLLGDRRTRVRVAVEAREVAAGDLDADPVPGHEDVARRREVDLVPVDRAGLEQRR